MAGRGQAKRRTRCGNLRPESRGQRIERAWMTGGCCLAQRLDKWLWFARVVRTRSLAAKLVAGGHVRVNSQRVKAPARPIGPGDMLTIALHYRVRVLRVIAAAARRGSARDAACLFEELTSGPELRPRG